MRRRIRRSLPSWGTATRTVEDHLAAAREKIDAADRNEGIVFYHRAINAKLEKEKEELRAQLRARDAEIAALRRQLRGRS